MYLSLEESEAKDNIINYCQKQNISFIGFVRDYRKNHPDLKFGQALMQIKEEVIKDDETR